MGSLMGWRTYVKLDLDGADRVADAEDEVQGSKDPNAGHHGPERGRDDAQAHGDDEQEEERERVACRVENGDDDEERD